MGAHTESHRTSTHHCFSTMKLVAATLLLSKLVWSESTVQKCDGANQLGENDIEYTASGGTMNDYRGLQTKSVSGHKCKSWEAYQDKIWFNFGDSYGTYTR